MDKQVKAAVNNLSTELCQSARQQSKESHDSLPATVEAIARLLSSSGSVIPVSDEIGFLAQSGGGEDE